MNRAVAVILGVFLFCTGLFLGMVGSFFRTLPTEPPHYAVMASRATNAAAVAAQQKAGDLSARPVRKKVSSAPEDPSESVESALVDALQTLAVALASQPATIPAQPTAPQQTEPEPVTPAPDADVPNQFASTSPPEPTGSLPPPPAGGHWAYDNQAGWLWMPEGAPAYVFVPAVEVYPGGFVTIRPGSRRGASSSRANRAPPQTTPSSSVIDPTVPGSRRSAAWSPFSNGVKKENAASSQKPKSSVIQPVTPGSK